MFPSPQQSVSVDAAARSVLHEADMILREALVKCRLHLSLEDGTRNLTGYLVTILLSLAADVGLETPAAPEENIHQAFLDAAERAFVWARSRQIADSVPSPP